MSRVVDVISDIVDQAEIDADRDGGDPVELAMQAVLALRLPDTTGHAAAVVRIAINTMIHGDNYDFATDPEVEDEYKQYLKSFDGDEPGA